MLFSFTFFSCSLSPLSLFSSPLLSFYRSVYFLFFPLYSVLLFCSPLFGIAFCPELLQPDTSAEAGSNLFHKHQWSLVSSSLLSLILQWNGLIDRPALLFMFPESEQSALPSFSLMLPSLRSPVPTPLPPSSSSLWCYIMSGCQGQPDTHIRDYHLQLCSSSCTFDSFSHFAKPYFPYTFPPLSLFCAILFQPALPKQVHAQQWFINCTHSHSLSYCQSLSLSPILPPILSLQHHAVSTNQDMELIRRLNFVANQRKAKDSFWTALDPWSKHISQTIVVLLSLLNPYLFHMSYSLIHSYISYFPWFVVFFRDLQLFY